MGWGGQGRNNGCKWCAVGQCWGCKSNDVQGRGGKASGKGGKATIKSQNWVKPQAPSGKGWGKQTDKDAITKAAPAERKIWISGLQPNRVGNDLNRQLQAHLSQAGSCKYAEIKWSGMGCAIFGCAEDAANAVATMNGSTFKGNVLQVDTWTKKDGASY
eukprot:TRINITY_DN5489_c0_g1_i1.p1 TRINITY_DN5489_c0_g1~~TRINITY_DN5489_c0_g1_i1.p1  ORF type:complete len:159 (-),score=28.50 TRINITY_DN5489_c0_g1_i1:76-552(-)